MRTRLAVVMITLSIAWYNRHGPANGMILFFAVWQITTAIAGHFFVPVVEFCHRRYNGVRSQFHAITFFTLLISLGWSGLLVSSGYGAVTSYRKSVVSGKRVSVRVDHGV